MDVLKGFLNGNILSKEVRQSARIMSDARVSGFFKGRQPRNVGSAKNLDPFSTLRGGDEATTGDQHLGAAQGMTYERLGEMRKTSLASAIVNTRITQVGEFLNPAPADDALGFKIQLRERERLPSREEIRTANRYTDWFLTCGEGYSDNPNPLETFGAMFLDDSLTWDQACFEKILRRNGKIAGFQPVDGKTMRRALPTHAEWEAQKRNPFARRAYVQVIQDRVVREWSSRKMAFCVRRPRAAIETFGYGNPELQTVVELLDSLLFGLKYNTNNFTHGWHAAGVMVLRSRMPRAAFKAFKRQLRGQQTGVANARRTSVVKLNPDAGESLESVSVTNNNREMEFQEWLKYLRAEICSVFQIDQAELGHPTGNNGQSVTVFQQSPEQSILASQARGLRPLVRFVFRALNHHVMRNLDPRYEIVPVGIDAGQRKAQLDRDIEKLGSFMSVEEIRARYDLPAIDPAIDGGASKMVGDPSYRSTAVQLLQMKAMEQAEAATAATEAAPDPFADPALDPDSLEEIDVDSLFPEEAEG